MKAKRGKASTKSSPPKAARPPGLRVLVTGGATNLGRAITERFLRDGARVAIGQLDTAAASDLLKLHGDRVIALRFDQGSPNDCRALVEEATRRLGGLDVLVNNAAITGMNTGRPFLDLDAAFIDRMLDVNLKGVIHLSVAAARAMRTQGTGGVIVHISSITAFRPMRGLSIYSAAKGALVNLTQSMAKELGPFGIRVVAIAPGDIWTDNFEEVRKKRAASGSDHLEGRAVLGQGQPTDIGEVVAFAASSRGRYITGTTIVVDGGLLA